MPEYAEHRAARLFALLLVVFGVAIATGLLALAANAGHWGLYLAGAGLIGATIVCWIRLTMVAARERHLQRLVLGVEAVAAGATPRLPPLDRNELEATTARLLRAVAVLIERLSEPSNGDPRMTAIIAAMPQPVIVLNANALVSLVNKAAMDLLGAKRVKIGTSVLDAVTAPSLNALLGEATPGVAVSGRLILFNDDEVQARVQALPDHGGWVVVLEAGGAGGAGLDAALELHDTLPPRIAPEPQTPLDQLTVVVLDCETTGLNVGLDRLLSLAAVRVQGAKLFRGETIDLLFDPGEPIPPVSTAIHGITNAMLMGERPFPERWPDIEPMLRDCVVVGHNIGFDLTLLETELRRAGILWRRPPSLCTAQLTAALDPAQTDLNLEAVAQAYGIPVAGRHTAFGDAMTTAEIYLHLLALMQARGDRTLADAQARAATARRVIREQQAAGW